MSGRLGDPTVKRRHFLNKQFIRQPTTVTKGRKSRGKRRRRRRRKSRRTTTTKKKSSGGSEETDGKKP